MIILFDEEDFDKRDPSGLPQRNDIPVLPGDETEICNTCLWCDFIPKSNDPGCYVKWSPGWIKALVEYFPVEPDKRACEKWRRHPITTFKQRLMIRRMERRVREAAKAEGDTIHPAADLSDRQRRDDAEQDRQDKKLGR